MPRILRITRRLPKETVQLERFLSLDAQGMPTYDSPVDCLANVLEYDVADGAAEFVTKPDGSRVTAPLTLYVRGDAAAETVPLEQDRITLGDGRKFIGVEYKPVSGLLYTRGQPDHYRIRCRVE